MHVDLLIDPSPLAAAPACGVVVAFSGGLDSTVLLHALASTPAMSARGLRAVHVHHGLHAHADLWQAHCERACAALGVDIHCVRVDVARDGLGLEAGARHARHAAFRSVLRAGEVIALGHHQDDQAETFLLRALRASGPDGLAAMRPWRAFGPGWMWRPLLDTPRAALRRYADANTLHWIDDPGNADPSLDRNFIRHHVMPTLRQRWPHADAAFARSAALSADAVAMLDAGDATLLDEARTGSRDVLDVRSLLQQAQPRRARVLRRWIASLGLPPLPADAVRRVETELLAAPEDAQPQVQWPGARLRRWRHLVQASAPATRWELPDAMHWSGDVPAALPDGGSLSLEPPVRLPWKAMLRARRGGERILLAGRSHRHQLKHLLQERDVPPWDRERLPLVVDEHGELLAAGDVVISGRLAGWLEAHATRLTWHRGAGAS